MKLLDTSIVVWLLRGRTGVVERAKKDPDICISWVTHAELLIGAMRKSAAKGVLAQVTKFSDSVKVLFPDCVTCDRYANIQTHLLSEGTPIPSNDLWIAALAIQHELVLVTSDEHFRAVPHLAIENWAE